MPADPDVASTVAAGDVPAAVLRRAEALLLELCAISSPSGDLAGLSRMAHRLATVLATTGLAPEVVMRSTANGAAQPVLVARGPAAGERYLLLIGHLDTVLPAVSPALHGERIDGTGALDMKGGFAALVGAFELLTARGRAVPTDLVLIAVPDEEVGGPISEGETARWGRGARAVLVLEPGESRGATESLVTGRRGLAGWRLGARGRAAHSGLAYWEGRSALAAAAAWCGEVQQLSERGSGPIVNVARILGGDAEFVDELAEHHSLVGTNHRLNIVPDRCVVEGEVRFLRAADLERTLARMRELAASVGAGWEVALELDVFETIAPVDPNGPGGELARFLVTTAAQAGWTLELEPDRGGVSFPNFLPDASAVPVLDGLGPVGGGMHTRNEHLELRSLERRIGLLAALLERLA